MFPDSLTFSVDAAYASQAFCGVPSILDECYNRTIFCWLFHFTLNLPWQQANSPKQKSMIFTLKGDPVPSWSIGQKIRLHFIHTPQLWNCSVPSGEAGEKQTKWQERKCECVREVHICWRSRKPSEISVITIYIYIGTSHSSASLSPSSSVALSIVPPLHDSVTFSCKM